MIKFKKIKIFCTILLTSVIFSKTFFACPKIAFAQTNKTAQYPVVQTQTMYTYEEMNEDIKELHTLYPDLVTVGSTGTSALGRNIPYFTIGNINSGHNILIQSTVHAREYIATQVVMKMAEYYLSQDAQNPELLDNVCFYIMPMNNPDGVAITQFGTKYITNQDTVNFVKSTGHISEWKANAMGVDINRNFDIGWENLTPRVKGRSYKDYKGDTKVSEPETKALINFASARNYDCFLSYHMQGNVIYYDEPGNTIENSTRSTLLAKAISNVNGYQLRNLNVSVATNEVQQGGFNDWVQIRFNKPGCTIELGTSLPPKAQKTATFIYNKNRDTWKAVAKLYY